MSDDTDLKNTPLLTLHQQLEAKIVPFAGYRMPVQYPTGIITEHNHTRNAAGLFDVAHMGQISVSGDQAGSALESLMPMSLADLPVGKQRYCFLTNDEGGIRDDLMVTRRQQDYLLVVNAACKDQDLAHIRANISDRAEIVSLTSQALLALQGPAAATVLAEFAPEAETMAFMSGRQLEVAGLGCFVTRSGYTGEDGFEISVLETEALELARTLLTHEAVAPIGLGARDSLRLEAGLCLYGHDISDSTTPVEAGLTWAIQKSRRTGGERAAGFPGAERILAQLEHGAGRRRVGIKPTGKAPVREGAELIDANDRTVGMVTSGGFGPSCGHPVAMGYVNTGLHQAGTALRARVRKRLIDVEVWKLPFVAHNYIR